MEHPAGHARAEVVPERDLNADMNNWSHMPEFFRPVTNP